AAEAQPDVPALKGWRRRVFGEDALALKRGELGLAVRGRRVVVMPLARDGEPAAGGGGSAG
ncbi:MAG TPA: hypothetical protein VFG47_04355, partial [Geminicoccaceae bacterium]|nr:hypothetical protein [Geminicoccaceae bacterium]